MNAQRFGVRQLWRICRDLYKRNGNKPFTLTEIKAYFPDTPGFRVARGVGQLIEERHLRKTDRYTYELITPVLRRSK